MERPEARLQASKAGVGINLVLAASTANPAEILRTDRNNAGAGGHSLNVIEVVSTVYLRNALALHDGDEVTVEIDG